MFQGYPSISSVDAKTKNWESEVPENNDWYIQEKVDGSQLSFRLDASNGEIIFKCKTSVAGPKNSSFVKSMTMLKTLKELLNPKYIYHGEAVGKRRHNTLTYERTPKYYFALYDIQDENNNYLGIVAMHTEAARVGLECVGLLYDNAPTREQKDPVKYARGLIDLIADGKIESCLGGPVEGVVIKHPNYYNSRKKAHSATKVKMVTASFKEFNHNKKPKKTDQTPLEYLGYLGSMFNNEARFTKALYRLRDTEKLTDDKKANFELLEQELDADFEKEYTKLVSAYLWAEFGPIISKKARSGFTKWYLKDREFKEPEEKTEKVEPDEVTKYLEELGLKFNADERFATVITESNLSVNVAIEALNTDFEHKYREQISLELWNKFKQLVMESARIGFPEWYAKVEL
jgi:hypothetical protein